METSRNSNLFLMELIFAIFFFILSSVICLQVFTKSHILNQRTEVLNFTNEIVQNETESFLATASEKRIDVETVYFTQNFSRTASSEESEYVLEKHFFYDDSFQYMTLSFLSSKDSIVLYEQTIKVLLTESEVSNE